MSIKYNNMSNFCTLKPKVKTKNGELKDSLLFPKLRKITDYNQKLSVSLYGKLKTDNFQQSYNEILDKDVNGEPTLRSLFENTDIGKFISEDKINTAFLKEAGLQDYKNPRELTRKEFLDVCRKSNKFNEANYDFPKFAIKVIRDEASKNYIVKADRFTKNTETNLIDVKNELSLHDFLVKSLNENGISVGVLTNYEERLGLNGVTDFSVCKTATKESIEAIRLAKGEKGRQALPEEYSHLIIEALEDKNPLVGRLLKHIMDNDLAKEILGDEYDSYREKYLDDKYDLAKEAAGKLLARKITSLYGKEKQDKEASPLVNRIFESFKSLFGKMDEKSYERALEDAEKDATIFAKQIIDGTISKNIDFGLIKSDKKFFQINESKEKEKHTARQELEKIIEKEKRTLEMLKNKKASEESIKYKESFIEQLEEDLKKQEIVAGINAYIKSSLVSAKNLTGKMRDKDFFGQFNLHQKMASLRKLQLYAETASFNIDEIDKRLDEFTELSEEDRADLRNRCAAAREKIQTLKLVVNQNEKVPVYEFFSGYCQDKMTITMGARKGEVVSLADEMEEIDGDISFKNRWLDAMCDTPDSVLSVISLITKTAKEKGRLATIEIRKKIDVAQEKLNKAGIKDTSFMFERDVKGKRTGKYITEEQAKKLDDARYEYYKSFMEIKKHCDGLLPAHRIKTNLQTIKVRKDGLERIKSSDNKVKNIGILFREKFVLNSNDVAEYGANGIMQNYQGKKMRSLPLYYIEKSEGETEEDMSEDCSGCLLAYAGMAEDYNQMNNIVDGIEITRDYLAKTRKTAEMNWKGEKLKDKNGNVVYAETASSNWLARFDDFITMQVYGEYTDSKTPLFGSKFSKEKFIDTLGSITAFNSLSFNLMTQISNVATGTVQMMIEQSGGHYFTAKNVFHADAIYARNVGAMLAEYGNPIKKSKLSLFNEKFNTLQKYDKEIKDRNYIASRAAHIITPEIGMLGQDAGEHWMQTRTALAIADTYKLKDEKGEEVSLWDALEVKFADEKNKSGAYLSIKKGIKKTDGTKFTENDFTHLSLVSADINNHMHGIYNNIDKSAIQKYAIGRACIMFRKYLIPSLNKRFEKGRRNVITNEWTQGYYRTTLEVGLRLYKSIKKIGLFEAIHQETLSKEEKEQLKKARTEMMVLISICAAIAFLGNAGEDKRDVWAARMAKYQLLRLKTEIGALTPSSMMPKQALKLLDSPAASLSTLEQILNAFGVANPYNYSKIMKSGPYKGHSEAYKDFMNMPIIGLAQAKVFRKDANPEQLDAYFK